MISWYREENVRHVNVACNLMACCLNSEGRTEMALRWLKMSWQLMNYHYFCFVILTDKMKQVPFNAAKIKLWLVCTRRDLQRNQLASSSAFNV